MDKLVTLVKLLLVAVYVIYECECDMLSLDQAMCPDFGKTVVTGFVRDVGTSDANGNIEYSLYWGVTYKEGNNELKVSNQRFTMRFPPNGTSCGYTFTNDGKSYLFAGDVDSDGIFSSDMCQYVHLRTPILRIRDYKNLLHGRRNASCL